MIHRVVMIQRLSLIHISSARSRIVADTAEDKESDEMELLLIKGGGR